MFRSLCGSNTRVQAPQRLEAMSSSASLCGSNTRVQTPHRVEAISSSLNQQGSDSDDSDDESNDKSLARNERASDKPDLVSISGSDGGDASVTSSMPDLVGTSSDDDQHVARGKPKATAKAKPKALAKAAPAEEAVIFADLAYVRECGLRRDYLNEMNTFAFDPHNDDVSAWHRDLSNFPLTTMHLENTVRRLGCSKWAGPAMDPPPLVQGDSSHRPGPALLAPVTTLRSRLGS